MTHCTEANPVEPAEQIDEKLQMLPIPTPEPQIHDELQVPVDRLPTMTLDH
jgi:hypothetical protein